MIYIFLFFINVLLNWSLTIDSTCYNKAVQEAASVALSKENLEQDVRKVTSKLMEILYCHSPLTPEKSRCAVNINNTPPLERE